MICTRVTVRRLAPSFGIFQETCYRHTRTPVFATLVSTAYVGCLVGLKRGVLALFGPTSASLTDGVAFSTEEVAGINHRTPFVLDKHRIFREHLRPWESVFVGLKPTHFLQKRF